MIAVSARRRSSRRRAAAESFAVRFDAATDQLELAAGLSTDPITVTAWVRNQTANASGTFFRQRAGATVATFCASAGGLNGPQLSTTGGTAGPFIPGVGDALPIGGWRRVGFTISGTGSNNCTCYWGDADPATSLQSVAGTVAVGTGTGTSVGGRGGGDNSESWGGDIAFMRVWAATLTGAEMKTELASRDVVVTSGIWAHWALQGALDLTDHSGNGRGLSVGSTSVTTVSGPPI